MLRIKNNFLITLIVSSTLISQSCIKNSVNIEVVKDGCRFLGIRNAKYDLIQDPCDKNVFSVFSECTHNEDTSCIHLLKVSPVFYNEFNQAIPLTDIDSVYKGKAFFLNEKEISFNYKYTFANQSTPQTKVNYAVLTYLIESEFKDQSNSLSLRIHFPCTVIDEDDYTVINPDSIIKVDRTPGTFPVDFWDNAAEDGDRIAAYLNDHIIIWELELFNQKKRFDLPKMWLNPGYNDLVVFALNEGSSGPNTVSMAINDKEIDLGTFAKGLRTGNAVRIDF